MHSTAKAVWEWTARIWTVTLHFDMYRDGFDTVLNIIKKNSLNAQLDECNVDFAEV